MMKPPSVIMPSGWTELPSAVFAQRWYYKGIAPNGISVIVEREHHGDDLWLHVSLSRADGIPTYEDVAEVKTIFVGRFSKAVMVFPSETEHVNHHPYCLHLFSNLDRDPLPDFRRDGGML